MLYKNVSSQKIAVFAYTASTGAAKTGDAAQITAYISKDFAAGAATNDANPTEMDATNMPGWYVFDLTQAETNAEVIVLAPKSSTSGVVLDQAQVFTQDAAISSRASQTSVDDVPTAVEIVAAIDADPPAVNVTMQQGVAVAPADANGNVPVVLYGTQGAVTFGQVKILANVDGEGALHLVSSSDLGYGLYTEGGAQAVFGVDPNGIRAAIGMAAANLDTQLGDLPTNAELATALAAADDAVLAAVADVPTVAEFEARTLAAAEYVVVSDLPSVPSAADIKTALEADGSKLDHLWEMTEDDGGVRRLTANALEEAPAGGSGTADWTSDEREQIRYRLQLDGTQTAPADTDLPSVNVTMQAGVAVAAADVNGNVPVVLYGTQPSVTFGKITINPGAYQPALHIVSNLSNAIIGATGLMVGLTSPGVAQVTDAVPDAQDIADALLLAPSGAAADGSAMDYLADILEDTGTTLPAAIAGISAAGDPWSTALPGAYGAGTAGALLSGIDSNVDLLLAADTSTSDATTAGAISRRRGNSWAIPLTIGAITGYTSLWFTIKSSYDDADTSALVQVKLNSPSALDGLLYVNGTTASSAALGSITVSDAATGEIVVNVDETITDDLAPGAYYYDVQTLIAGAVATPDSGVFTVTADVTRSVT